jgi:hypothetical protein
MFLSKADATEADKKKLGDQACRENTYCQAVTTALRFDPS